jgi:hypothetical protein
MAAGKWASKHYIHQHHPATTWKAGKREQQLSSPSHKARAVKTS